MSKQLLDKLQFEIEKLRALRGQPGEAEQERLVNSLISLI